MTSTQLYILFIVLLSITLLVFVILYATKTTTDSSPNVRLAYTIEYQDPVFHVGVSKNLVPVTVNHVKTSTWKILPEQLPLGLAFNPQNGAITGILSEFIPVDVEYTVLEFLQNEITTTQFVLVTVDSLPLYEYATIPDDGIKTNIGVGAAINYPLTVKLGSIECAAPTFEIDWNDTADAITYGVVFITANGNFGGFINTDAQIIFEGIATVTVTNGDGVTQHIQVIIHQ